MPDIQKVQPENQSPEVEDIFGFDEAATERPVPQPEQPPVPDTLPEREAMPELAPETMPEQQPESEQSRLQYAPPAPPVQTQPVSKDPQVEHIENILAEHLEGIFVNMSPQEQMAFKVKGEETATKINVLLQETKIKVRSILDLIREWLQLIPGVNRFFVEQEAKIKTDRLLNLREQQK
ncbi:MAG: hypothetical protein ACOYUK_01765 [Patescibacteria group bacterium]